MAMIKVGTKAKVVIGIINTHFSIYPSNEALLLILSSRSIQKTASTLSWECLYIWLYYSGGIMKDVNKYRVYKMQHQQVYSICEQRKTGGWKHTWQQSRCSLLKKKCGLPSFLNREHVWFSGTESRALEEQGWNRSWQCALQERVSACRIIHTNHLFKPYSVMLSASCSNRNGAPVVWSCLHTCLQV